MAGYTQFRLRRMSRRVRRSVRRTRSASWQYARMHLFGKWRQLAMIRRFALAWWGLIAILLIGTIVQTSRLASKWVVVQALPGGSYSEAVVGSVKNINPILPEGSPSADAAQLVFDGLTRFSSQGQLQPDLAKSWTVSRDAKTYTFQLRRNVHWQDGVPLSSQDILFTIAAIQNPDTRSPLSAGWKNVRVTAPDDHTVVFALPKPYAPFLNTTTVGILPAHLLENTTPSQLRVSAFNQSPVGTGPYRIEHFDSGSGEINLAANSGYFGGRPLINAITLKIYATPAAALTAYQHRQVQGVDRIGPNQIDTARNLGTMQIYQASLPAEVGVFLQTANSPVLKDKAVRQALATATDRQAIVAQQLRGQATPLASPLLPQPLIKGAPHQPDLNRTKASNMLSDDGWTLSHAGIRSKSGQTLRLTLVTQSDSTYDAVAHELARQWALIGVQTTITEVDPDTLQQSYIRTRRYDALLYGINVGADPDVYTFWDSSQIKDPGLNLSAYSSPAADRALESARIIDDPTLRAAKYRSFIQTWVADAPAVMLYTPLYDYGVDDSVHGISIRKLITPSDRFYGIEHWSVRQREVPGIPTAN